MAMIGKYGGYQEANDAFTRVAAVVGNVCSVTVPFARCLGVGRDLSLEVDGYHRAGVLVKDILVALRAA